MLTFDHLDPRLPFALFNRLGDIEADIAAASNDNTMCFRLLMSKQ